MGRERGAARGGREPLWLTCALDAIARHRASGEPLDRCVGALERSRRLGKRERARARDLAFSWARHRVAAERRVNEALEAFGGVAPAVRDRDLAAMLLAVRWAGLAPVDGPELKAPLDALVESAADEAEGGSYGKELPAWVRRRLADVTDDVSGLEAALLSPAPVTLAVDTTLAPLDEVEAAVKGLGVEVTRSPVCPDALRCASRFSLGALPEAMRDAVWPMDDGSQLVARTLGAREGESVLDLCAGGGGKSRLMRSSGARLVCSDVDVRRMEAVRDRVGKGALMVRADGRNPPFAPGTFDRVLVDAPCSGLGTLRRAPDLLSRLDERSVKGFAALQQELLVTALDLVRPGGLVVYATCSLLPEENDAVVDAALKKRPRSAEVPLSALWSFDPRPEVDDAQSRVALLPSKEGTDGFYIAALRRPK